MTKSSDLTERDVSRETPVTSELPSAVNAVWDRFLVAPRNGQTCPVSGFSHGRFYSKVINGPGRKHVRIIDLREPRQTRASKLYHAGDLYQWLDSLARSQARAYSGADNSVEKI